MELSRVPRESAATADRSNPVGETGDCVSLLSKRERKMRSWDSLDAHLRMMSRKRWPMEYITRWNVDFHSEVFSEKERRSSIVAGIPSIGKDNYYWLYGYYGMGNRNKHGSYWTSVQTL